MSRASQESFFANLWRDYVAMAPQAAQIQQLFIDGGESIVNDHVAFRTFDSSPIDMASLEPHILNLGYQYFEDYQFVEKHLRAKSYLPLVDGQPRIFISELCVSELSPTNQSLIESYCQHIDAASILTAAVFYHGRFWPGVRWCDYQQLLAESEYAAWLAVMGLRANHFTLSINALEYPDIQGLAAKVERAGFAMNSVGGVVKGRLEDGLQQCATLASRIEVTFSGGDKHVIPACYYEFALRYPQANGQLYQGFVPANANKIFHSTDSHS